MITRRLFLKMLGSTVASLLARRKGVDPHTEPESEGWDNFQDDSWHHIPVSFDEEEILPIASLYDGLQHFVTVIWGPKIDGFGFFCDGVHVSEIDGLHVVRDPFEDWEQGTLDFWVVGQTDMTSPIVVLFPLPREDLFEDDSWCLPLMDVEPVPFCPDVYWGDSESVKMDATADSGIRVDGRDIIVEDSAPIHAVGNWGEPVVWGRHFDSPIMFTIEVPNGEVERDCVIQLHVSWGQCEGEI